MITCVEERRFERDGLLEFRDRFDCAALQPEDEPEAIVSLGQGRLRRERGSILRRRLVELALPLVLDASLIVSARRRCRCRSLSGSRRQDRRNQDTNARRARHGSCGAAK